LGKREILVLEVEGGTVADGQKTAKIVEQINI